MSLNMHQSKKFVFIGDSGVGKTTVIRKYIIGIDVSTSEPTIGASFYTSQRHHANNKPIQIWDTAGQDRFRSVCPVYYRNSSGAICIFDVTNRNSFDNINSWIDSFKKYALPEAMILIIANKIDQNEYNWKVTMRELEMLCEVYHCDYVMTSGKEGWNSDIFDEKLKKICDEVSNVESKVPDNIFLFSTDTIENNVKYPNVCGC